MTSKTLFFPFIVTGKQDYLLSNNKMGKPQMTKTETETQQPYYVRRRPKKKEGYSIKAGGEIRSKFKGFYKKVEKRFLTKEEIEEMKKKGKKELKREELEKFLKDFFGVNKKEFLGIERIEEIEGIEKEKLRDLIFNELIGIKKELKGIEKVEAKIRDVVFNGRKYWGKNQEVFDEAIKELGEYMMGFDKRYLEEIFKRGKRKINHSIRNKRNRLLRNSEAVVEVINPSAYYNKMYYIKGNEPEFLTPNKYKLIRDLAGITEIEGKKEEEDKKAKNEASKKEERAKEKAKRIKERKEKQTDRERRRQILLNIRAVTRGVK